MSREESQWLWIAARLSGSGTPEDDQKLNEWINASEANEVLYHEIVKIWEASGKKLTLADPLTDEEWKRLHKRITTNTLEHSISMWRYWIGAAACILLLLAYGIYSYRSGMDKAIPMDKSIVAGEQVKTFYLPDSSKVWLNVGREIGYMNSFGKTDRTISLTGEAYFDVRKNVEHQFIINTKNGSITVVGTSFNVKDAEVLSVVVEEGIVKMRSKSDDDQQVELTQGERGEASNEGLKEMKNEDPLFSAWRKKNNPLYTKEVEEPLQFLQQQYSWKESSLNQTQVDGYIVSNATLATYEKVTLKISYQRPNRKMVVSQFMIDQPVYPGQKVYYHKRLLDFFVKNPAVKVEIESAQPVVK